MVTLDHIMVFFSFLKKVFYVNNTCQSNC